MKYERGSFITVPSREALRGLHPTAQSLYMWLCCYANETSHCFPSRKTLSKDVGCSESTIDNMLVVLEEKGLIQKKGRKSGGTQLSNLYTVLVVPPVPGGTPPPTEYAPPSHEVRTNSNQLTQTIERGVASAPHFLEVFEPEEDTRPKRPTKAKYANAKIAFSWLPNQQKSWDRNITELECGLLLFGRGEEDVRKFVRYVKGHENDDHFNWVFVKPSDYERKWEDIKAYAKRNS